MEYYSASKKNEILPLATTWMEREVIMLSEIRERQKPYDFTHMRTLRDKTEETHKYGEQTEGYWRVCGRGNELNG